MLWSAIFLHDNYMEFLPFLKFAPNLPFLTLKGVFICLQKENAQNRL